ncbi:MAG: hypothetical protein ACJ8GJ_11085 [Vitreoscilla sp.]
MASPKHSDRTGNQAPDGGDASARSQQELYSRAEPQDLDEGRIGRDDPSDVENPDPGRDVDGTGQPSTARANANTTT